MTLRQLMRVAKTAPFFLFSFRFSRRQTVEDERLVVLGGRRAVRFWKGKGREEKGLKRTGCKTEKKKENKIQRKHSAYHSGLETLVQKSYTGPRGTKYNVSVDSYLHESAQ